MADEAGGIANQRVCRGSEILASPRGSHSGRQPTHGSTKVNPGSRHDVISKSLVRSLTEAGSLLRDQRAGTDRLNEDELYARRARTKYVTQYRRAASARVTTSAGGVRPFRRTGTRRRRSSRRRRPGLALAAAARPRGGAADAAAGDRSRTRFTRLSSTVWDVPRRRRVGASTRTPIARKNVAATRGWSDGQQPGPAGSGVPIRGTYTSRRNGARAGLLSGAAGHDFFLIRPNDADSPTLLAFTPTPDVVNNMVAARWDRAEHGARNVRGGLRGVQQRGETESRQPRSCSGRRSSSCARPRRLGEQALRNVSVRARRGVRARADPSTTRFAVPVQARRDLPRALICLVDRPDPGAVHLRRPRACTPRKTRPRRTRDPRAPCARGCWRHRHLLILRCALVVRPPLPVVRDDAVVALLELDIPTPRST